MLRILEIFKKKCVTEINREITLRNGNDIAKFRGGFDTSRRRENVRFHTRNNSENVSVVNDGRITIDRFRSHARRLTLISKLGHRRS